MRTTWVHDPERYDVRSVPVPVRDPEADYYEVYEHYIHQARQGFSPITLLPLPGGGYVEPRDDGSFPRPWVLFSELSTIESMFGGGDSFPAWAHYTVFVVTFELARRNDLCRTLQFPRGREAWFKGSFRGMFVFEDQIREHDFPDGLVANPVTQCTLRGMSRRAEGREDHSLPIPHRRTKVSYVRFQGVKALEGKFSRAFDHQTWERHLSCQSIDQTPGEREFVVARVPREFCGSPIDLVWDKLADHFHQRGYRFAIEIEALEFAEAYPEIHRKNWIYALGSSALANTHYRCVPVLNAIGCYSILSEFWSRRCLGEASRLLLVRI